MAEGIRPVFQLSLDLSEMRDAVALARVGVDAGIDVLEAGTILILSEGAKRAVTGLRQEFPDHPLVADIKCTDGAAYETALMYDLGATAVTVMASASDASIRYAVREANTRRGCAVMVDTMGFGGPDGTNVQGQVDAAKRVRDLGAHYVVLHLGFDERSENRRMVDENVLLRWTEAVREAELSIPIQVVGGLTLAQARELPALGIRDIVVSMNLGSRPLGEMRYDQVTGFTVDLQDAEDREKVGAQLRRFVSEVRGDS